MTACITDHLIKKVSQIRLMLNDKISNYQSCFYEEMCENGHLFLILANIIVNAIQKIVI